MNLEGKDEELLRKYLLGEMSEAEQQAFEERLVSDEELVELLLSEEDELIDDYLSGDLLEGERERFDSYFMATPERQKKLKFAGALRRQAPVPNPALDPTPATNATPAADLKPARDPKPARNKWWTFSNPYVQWATATAVVVAVGVGSWRAYEYLRQRPMSKGMLALKEAYPNERPTESRISEWNYAPPAPITRGAAGVNTDYVALDRAKALIQLEANEHPSARSYHDLGRLYLAEREFEKAIDQFERALKLDPENAQVHSDYGAAQLELGKADALKGERGKSLEGFAKSLEHLNRAIELDSSLLEPLFNRALCREYMMLTQQSENDWRLYLEKDSTSRWADEARQRLREREKQNINLTPTKENLYKEFLGAFHSGDRKTAWETFRLARARVGNSIVERLVDEYLQAEPRSDEAQVQLKALSYAADLEVENVGDRFTLDLARFYGSADASKKAVMKKARELVTTGQIQIAKSEFKSGFESYDLAKRAFDEVGNRCESSSADYWMAICRMQQVDPQEGSLKFNQIVKECERSNYKWLTIRSSNALANHNLIIKDYSEAIRYSARSNLLAKQIQDTYGQVIAVANLVRSYSSLGDHRQTLDYLQQLVKFAGEESLELNQLNLCFARAAWTMYSEGFPAASLEYQKAAIEVALELNELTMICTSYAHLGLIYAKLKNFDQALSSINKALEVAERRSAERTGSLMAAYSTLRLGTVYRQMGDQPNAIENYNRAVDIYSRLKHPSYIHEAHKGLVLSYIAMGSPAAATEELAKAIEYYEDHRSKIREQDNRNSFFDLENDIYDIAIDFEYSKGSPERAFDYSELNRARSLLDLITKSGDVKEGPEQPDRGPVTKPLRFAELQKRLPKRAQVLQYAVLQDKLLTLFLTRSSFQSLEQPINSRVLGELVQNYLRLVSIPGSDPAELSNLSRQLYGILIAPIETHLSNDSQIFIVADKILNNVPFQSLLSPAGKYLVEDFAVQLSPSSSVLIACTEAANRKSHVNHESIFGLGVTHFKATESVNLPDLPSAAREVRDIARSYSSSAILINDRARKQDALREMGKANVIHLASHFITNDSSPLRSRLLLFSEKGDYQRGDMPDQAGALAASEIFKMRLPSAKLAVLSACRTGMDRYYRGEGALGFAHAFIAADVPLVVASLWSVDSNATTELMINFHKNRKSQVSSSAEALRKAQLAMLHGPESSYRHPYYWASFNLIGGYAEY